MEIQRTIWALINLKQKKQIEEARIKSLLANSGPDNKKYDILSRRIFKHPRPRSE